MRLGLGRGVRWFSAAALAVVVILLVWAVQTGSCADRGGGGVGGECTSAPVVGFVGAWALTLGGSLFVLYALRRGMDDARARDRTR